jgi:hypothetical protein
MFKTKCTYLDDYAKILEDKYNKYFTLNCHTYYINTILV